MSRICLFAFRAPNKIAVRPDSFVVARGGASSHIIRVCFGCSSLASCSRTVRDVLLGALIIVAIGSFAGCRPEFSQPSSLVTETQFLAIRSEPPEIAPGGSVTFTALIASTTGTLNNPAVDWALCTTPKPLDENNVVSEACLNDGAKPVGESSGNLRIDIPIDACQLFGPDPPPQLSGQPPLRPRDPDTTGGFYQPVRVKFEGLTAIAMERISCNLANTSAEIAVKYREQYSLNRNPDLQPVVASVNGQPTTLDQLPAGEEITFQVSWPAEAVETFLVFDALTEALVERRESMRVSWFATAGKFEHERTGRSESELDTYTENIWHAPNQTGAVYLWVVLRDNRGGNASASYPISIVLF